MRLLFSAAIDRIGAMSVAPLTDVSVVHNTNLETFFDKLTGLPFSS